MEEKETSAILSHLPVRSKFSTPTRNQALCALPFDCGEILDQDLHIDMFENEVLTPKAHKASGCPPPKGNQRRTVVHGRLISSLHDASALRAVEGLKLRLKNQEFGYRQPITWNGKGNMIHTRLFSKRGNRVLSRMDVVDLTTTGNLTRE
jgi:hypothetical protein